jgi:hypothetical protein
MTSLAAAAGISTASAFDAECADSESADEACDGEPDRRICSVARRHKCAGVFDAFG